MSFELEEWVGSLWHRFVTRQASCDYPDARVQLADIQRHLAVLFRAMGGEGGIALEVADRRPVSIRRNLMQKLAGAGPADALAWRDADTLRLPRSLAAFPYQALNDQLYRWLVLLAAQATRMRHWGRDNQCWTVALLRRYPALVPRYRTLVQAHLVLRPDPVRMRRDEAALERAVRLALEQPGSVVEFPRCERAPWPVPMWLYPPQHDSEAPVELPDADEGDAQPSAGAHSTARKRATRVDDHSGKDGLLLIRLENLFSWSEHVDLDRRGDDGEDLDAARVAEDLDELAMSRRPTRRSGGLKLDLDLPPADVDDHPLEGPLALPEWDYRRQRLQDNHVQVQLMAPRASASAALPLRLAAPARRLRRQFERLRIEREWLHQQPSGSELDIQAWIDFHVERQHGNCVERGWFHDRRQTRRDLACLLLADVSMSTDAHLDDRHRVIDVIGDSLLLFGETLAAVGDRFAMYGFSSLRRQHVRMLELKAFSQRYGDDTRGRILALRPGYYTRMGAALRHATRLLAATPSRRKLLLLVTDGKPNDLDRYEGRYGVEDTRQAVIEARRKGLVPFCITIDREAADYLPYMFGANGYTLIRQPELLPYRLPQLYRQLTQA